MSKEVRDNIISIIQQEFEFLKLSDIDPDSPFRDNIDLDSMQLIGLISRLEQEFNVEIPLSAIDIETLNQFVGIVEKQIVVNT
jgi:acyl carrier protein